MLFLQSLKKNRGASASRVGGVMLAMLALAATAAPVPVVPAAAAAKPALPVTVIKPVVVPSRQQVLVRQYLYEAQDAFARGRLMAPKHDNAYAGFQRVLQIDPSNEAARTGIKRISRRYLTLAKTAEQDGDFERAIGYARQAQRIAPGYAGSAHLVQYLERRRAEHDAQEMQQVKAGGAVAVELVVKGNEYFVGARDVAARSVKAKAQLAAIAQKAKDFDSRILIVAKNDGDGRWIYSQMRDSLADYLLRGNIKVDAQTKIILLDQPAVPATQAAAPATVPAVIPAPASSPTTISTTP